MEPVAFVILSYNSFPDATRLCGDLLELPESENCRVILVDNASPNRRGHAQWAGIADSRVTRIEARENRGYSTGNNLGIDKALEAGIDRVVVFNPDVRLLDKDTLLARIDIAFQEHDFLVMGFSVTGIAPYFAALQTWALLFPVVARIFDRRKFHRLRRMDQLPRAFAVGRIYGCAFALRAKRFRDLGLFDEAVFLYGEETIVSHVSTINNSTPLQSSLLRVRHDPLGSFAGALSRRHYQWMTISMTYYLTKYRGWPRIVGKSSAAFALFQTFLSYWAGICAHSFGSMLRSKPSAEE